MVLESGRLLLQQLLDSRVLHEMYVSQLECYKRGEEEPLESRFKKPNNGDRTEEIQLTLETSIQWLRVCRAFPDSCVLRANATP